MSPVLDQHIFIVPQCSHGGCPRPDPNRRRRSEPSFLPDDVVGRGKRPRPEDAGGGGSLARSGLTWLRGPGSGFVPPLGCRDGGVWDEASVWAFGSAMRFQVCV